MSTEPTPKRRRRWVIWLRRLGLGLLGLLVTLVVAVLLVLYTQVGTRLAIDGGVSIYGDMIPGQISLAEVNGTLAGGVSLHELALSDREGRRLVYAEELRLEVPTDAVVVRGLRVHLPAEGEGEGFADLAPPATEEVVEEAVSDTLGPDLPLGLRLVLDLEDAQVLSGGEIVAAVSALRLRANAEGTEATAHLQTDLNVPAAELAIASLQLDAQWDDPQATITDLHMQSNLGGVTLSSVDVDVGVLSGSVAGLLVEVESSAWAERSGLAAALSPTLMLQGEASPEAVDLTAIVRAGEGGDARLQVAGTLVPTIDLVASLDVIGQTKPWGASLPERALDLELGATLSGTLADGLDARAAVTCTRCLHADHPLTLGLFASAAPLGDEDEESPIWTAAARLSTRYRNTRIDTRGWLTPQGRIGLDVELLSADLGQLSAVAREFVEMESVRGNLHGAVTCAARPDPWLGSCTTDLTLERGAPISDARLAATVWGNDAASLVVAVAEAHGKTPEAEVRLRGPGAHAAISPERIEVAGLDLELITPTGSGRLSAEGWLQERKRGRIAARVSNFDLGALSSFVPGPSFGGRLGGTAELSGTLVEPTVAVDMRATGLRAMGTTVGDVDLHAGYRAGELSTSVSVDSGELGRWSVDGRTRATVSASPAVFAMARRAPVRLDVEARTVSLRPLQRWLPDAAPLSGTIDLDLHLRGTATKPSISFALDTTPISAADRDLGRFELDADYDSGLASATLTAVHPHVKRFVVEGSVPIAVTMRGAPRWRSAREHSASVKVDEVDLAWVGGLIDVPLGGRLSVDAAAKGSAADVAVDVLVEGQSLAYGGAEIATGAATATYGDDAVKVMADFRGPAFSGFGLTASVPLTIDAARGQVKWHPREPHRVSVALVGGVIPRAIGAAGLEVDAEGTLDATVELRGSADAPRLVASVRGEDLGYGGRSVGEAELEAVYERGRATAKLRWDLDRRRYVRVAAEVPILADLGKGEVRWLDRKRHNLSVEAPRIDGRLLAPFVELPEDLDFAVSLHGLAEGTLSEFSTSAAVRGFVYTKGLDPARVEVDVDADASHQRVVARVGDRTSVVLDTEAPVVALRSGSAKITDIPVELQLAAKGVPLDFLGKVLPTQLYRVGGQLDVDASATGTVGRPVFAGQATVAEGSATVVALRQRFEKFSASLSFANDGITLTRLAANSGRGSLSATGGVGFSDGEATGTLAVQLDAVPAQRPGLPRLEITSNIDASLRASSERAKVTVQLKGSRVDVLSGNVDAAKSIPTSPRVEYVTQLAVARPSSDTPEQSPSSDAAEESSLPVELRVSLVDPLRIRGPAVDMSWEGSIAATSDDRGVVASGAFDSTEGFFELVSNRFTLERGRITVPEGDEIQLFADIVANANVGDVGVRAAIRGPLPRPELALTSTPALTESQIFTLLVTGSANFDEADPAQVQAQAASVLAALASPALQRQLNERLRVDRIGVGVGETTDEPIFIVGKNLTRRLYAETQYHHNAPRNVNRAELRVRYRFAPRWSLETFVGDAAAAGVDVLWGRSFDSERRRER